MDMDFTERVDFKGYGFTPGHQLWIWISEVSVVLTGLERTIGISTGFGSIIGNGNLDSDHRERVNRKRTIGYGLHWISYGLDFRLIGYESTFVLSHLSKSCLHKLVKAGRPFVTSKRENLSKIL